MILYDKGYLIKITSWENDGDYYNTIDKHVYSELEVEFIIKLAHMFLPWHKGGIGNIYNISDAELARAHELARALVDTNPEFFTEIEYTQTDEDCLDYIMDYAWDLGLTKGERFSRVLEDIKVYKIDEPIVVEEVYAYSKA